MLDYNFYFHLLNLIHTKQFCQRLISIKFAIFDYVGININSD